MCIDRDKLRYYNGIIIMKIIIIVNTKELTLIIRSNSTLGNIQDRYIVYVQHSYILNMQVIMRINVDCNNNDNILWCTFVLMIYV